MPSFCAPHFSRHPHRGCYPFSVAEGNMSVQYQKYNSLRSLTRICFLEIAPFRIAVQIRLGCIFIFVLQIVPHFVDSYSHFEKAFSPRSSISHNTPILWPESHNCKMWGCLLKRCQNLRGRALSPVSYITVLQLSSTFSFLLSSASHTATLFSEIQLLPLLDNVQLNTDETNANIVCDFYIKSWWSLLVYSFEVHICSKQLKQIVVLLEDCRKFCTAGVPKPATSCAWYHRQHIQKLKTKTQTNQHPVEVFPSNFKFVLKC